MAVNSTTQKAKGSKRVINFILTVFGIVSRLNKISYSDGRLGNRAYERKNTDLNKPRYIYGR